MLSDVLYETAPPIWDAPIVIAAGIAILALWLGRRFCSTSMGRSSTYALCMCARISWRRVRYSPWTSRSHGSSS